MFSFFTSLQYVSLPDGMIFLQSIEEMFQGCSSLTSINLGFLNGVSHLKACMGMFQGCSNLKEVNFPFMKSSSELICLICLKNVNL